jgi:hypothetical protein
MNVTAAAGWVPLNQGVYTQLLVSPAVLDFANNVPPVTVFSVVSPSSPGVFQKELRPASSLVPLLVMLLTVETTSLRVTTDRSTPSTAFGHLYAISSQPYVFVGMRYIRNLQVTPSAAGTSTLSYSFFYQEAV